MTFAMLVLLELCIRIKRESEISVRRRYIWSEYHLSIYMIILNLAYQV